MTGDEYADIREAIRERVAGMGLESDKAAELRAFMEQACCRPEWERQLILTYLQEHLSAKQ